MAAVPDGNSVTNQYEITIERPGVYDIPAGAYHADPVPGGSLSSSGAKRLLPPSCPALFYHWVTAGQEHKSVFDVGLAAHALVLGVGAPLVVIDAENWYTKSAKEQRDTAYEQGSTPLLRGDYEQVQAMATALREHPAASALFQPGSGRAEQSLFWVDDESGVWRRAMLDWLPFPNADGRLIIADYKTTTSLDPDDLSQALNKYSYFQQAAWYLDAVEALGLTQDEEPEFVFVFQMKTEPYLVTVAQPNPDAIKWGRRLNRKALDLYRECKKTGHWPGYTDNVISLTLPPWAHRQLETAWKTGAYDLTDDPS